MREQVPEPGAWKYVETTTTGTVQEMISIDDAIRAHLQHWSWDRLARVDRNLLRLACWEMLHHQDQPFQVYISEAVDLAKEYSDDNSGGFVNGVLDAIWRDRKKIRLTSGPLPERKPLAEPERKPEPVVVLETEPEPAHRIRVTLAEMPEPRTPLEQDGEAALAPVAVAGPDGDPEDLESELELEPELLDPTELDPEAFQLEPEPDPEMVHPGEVET